MDEGLELVSGTPFTVSADLLLSDRIGPYLVERDADVEIVAGDVPQSLDEDGWALGVFQVRGDRVLFAMPGGPRYLVEGGRRIVYARGAAGERDLLLYLLGTAFGIVCYQRGFLPLHASAVVRDGDVHAFTGESGAGKSTMVAALADRGHEFFTDDILVVPLQPSSGDIVCYAGQKDLKLWADALEFTSASKRGRVSDATRREKFFAMPQAVSERTSGRVKTLTLLRDAPDDTSALERVEGAESVGVLLESIYRLDLGYLLVGRSRIFSKLVEMARLIAVQRFIRPRDLALFVRSLHFFEENSSLAISTGRP